MDWTMNNESLLVGIGYNAYDPISGTRDERESEESVEQVAQDVYACITSVGYNSVLLPLGKSLMSFVRRMNNLKVDVLINLCEGYLGRPQFEANVAGVFEILGIPFTGSNSRALSLCQDKFKSKAILNAYGLPTARGRLISSADQAVELSFPLIVKPNAEDASLGIKSDSVVHDVKHLSEKVKTVIDKYHQPALVEEFIEGREFNVAVLDNDRLQALPVSEIDFSGMPDNVPRICSYEAKWFEDHILYLTTPPVCPARIEESLRERLQQLAVAAFQVMGCRDYARVDFRMGKDGRIYILEVNPNPDISLDAGYARALKTAGIAYHEFWGSLIERASARKERPWFSPDYGWDTSAMGLDMETFWQHVFENAWRRKEKRWYGQ